ncbi:hypothetical protein H1O16_gp383 [Burkholderia phage BcepSaruman]|uniref:Uncharacterized protein n=1 Tax=Burkholderia phage BcepSaruman TaxID=2530032 RepID=A0A4D5ZDY7_9CAUD|nr:hypothetical protein H1O16_gp383 [Burkholderia phage BcepSaruman]QBX06796.1 hypothetical protein BcepSaruman_383 [Burkholderia phage BcepSaruman]
MTTQTAAELIVGQRMARLSHLAHVVHTSILPRLAQVASSTVNEIYRDLRDVMTHVHEYDDLTYEFIDLSQDRLQAVINTLNVMIDHGPVAQSTINPASVDFLVENGFAVPIMQATLADGGRSFEQAYAPTKKAVDLYTQLRADLD